MYQIAAKAIQNNFYMDDFIKSVKTPEEAIEVFNQIQLLSQHGIELKKRKSTTKIPQQIPEDIQSINNAKQVEVKPNTKGSSVPGLQCTLTNDSLSSSLQRLQHGNLST